MAKEKSNENPAVVGVNTNYHNCECCNPAQNLFPRPDLAGIVEGTQIAVAALCIFHKPAVTIYIWSTENQKYEKNESLRFENQQILNADDTPVLSTSFNGAPSLLELDDEAEKNAQNQRRNNQQQQPGDGGPTPSTTEHVNLENDNYYGVNDGKDYPTKSNWQ